MSKKNKELSFDREDLDAQLEFAAQKRKKAQRKKKIRRLIIVALAVAVVIIGVIIAIAVKSLTSATDNKVQVTHGVNGELTQEVKISGTVSSDNIQHFYSVAAIEVDSVVPVGTLVKKGDPIITFEKESYEVALRQLELSDQIQENSYQSQVTNANDVQNKYYQAKADEKNYKALADEYQAKKDALDNKESDWYKFTYENGPTQIAIENEKIANAQAQLLNPALTEEEKARLSGIINEANVTINNINKQIKLNQEEYTDIVTKLTEYEAKYNSAKATAEALQAQIGNQYDRENRDLNGELNSLKTGSAYDELAKYKNGCLVAPFDGIVISSMVSEGMTTSSVPTEIISFASIEEVSIDFTITNKDLSKVKVGQKCDITILDNEYEGTVARISRMANVSMSGGTATISAVIKIDNPDDNIYLGVAAKATITTDHKDECLYIPSEALNVDDDGMFVYIVNDMNIIEKRRVTTGLATADNTEILEGLTVDDTVVGYVTKNVIEGNMVTPVDMAEGNALMDMLNQSGLVGY